MINNFSAALFGEEINFAAAEHLHSIECVYVELAFKRGNSIYIIGRKRQAYPLHRYK